METRTQQGGPASLRFSSSGVVKPCKRFCDLQQSGLQIMMTGSRRLSRGALKGSGNADEPSPCLSYPWLQALEAAAPV